MKHKSVRSTVHPTMPTASADPAMARPLHDILMESAVETLNGKCVKSHSFDAADGSICATAALSPHLRVELPVVRSASTPNTTWWAHLDLQDFR